jgi:serine/threonine-protein kinase RsbW
MNQFCLIGPDQAAFISTGEEVLGRARIVAREIESHVWSVIGEYDLPSPPRSDGTVLCLSVHSTADLPLVLDPVADAMDHLGFPDRDVFGVRLALEEALVNAIKHGNQANPAREVRVRCSVTAERVLAEVQDEGPGFDPTKVADPLCSEGVGRSGGRGLLLMRHYMSSVRYSGRGNAVTLCKQRSQ